VRIATLAERGAPIVWDRTQKVLLYRPAQGCALAGPLHFPLDKPIRRAGVRIDRSCLSHLIHLRYAFASARRAAGLHCAVPPHFSPAAAFRSPLAARDKHDGFRVSLARTAGALVRQQVLWEHWGVGNPPTQDVLRVPISGHGLRGWSSGGACSASVRFAGLRCLPYRRVKQLKGCADWATSPGKSNGIRETALLPPGPIRHLPQERLGERA
jgi:hypothetical protein